MGDPSIFLQTSQPILRVVSLLVPPVPFLSPFWLGGFPYQLRRQKKERYPYAKLSNVEDLEEQCGYGVCFFVWDVEASNVYQRGCKDMVQVGNLKKTHFCLTPLHGNLRLAPSSHGESQAAADESVFVGAGRSEMARPLQAVAAMSWGVLPLFMVVLRNIVFFCLVYGLSL